MEEEKEKKFIVVRIIMSLSLFLIALFVPMAPFWMLCCYLLAYGIIGFDIIIEAIKNTFHGHFLDENFLMFLATVGAFVVGEYPEAVVVMLLYQVGETLEDYALDKSRDSIAKLMNIRPYYANIEKEGALVKVAPEEIQLDDIIIVKPGEKIPLDGIVIEGESMIDTSNITGESVPVYVSTSATVYSGTINQSGMIKIKVTKTYENSTVHQILELVEKANHKKAKTENFITRFARYYTPIVVLFAILLAILPPIFLKNTSWMEYLHRACSFLVISCPCALVISIPLTFFAGLGGASRQGILIKGSNYIEALTKLQTIVFDKTGTLTKGCFEVSKICTINMTEEKLLEYAAYAENYFEHPIALSIKKAYEKPINPALITNSTDVAGRGVQALVNQELVTIGNYQFMQENDISAEKANEIGTILYIAIQNQYAGYIVLSDNLKEEVIKTLQELKQKHIHTAMLTGDHAVVAKEVANKVGIDNVYAELLPQDKVSKMEEILSQKNSSQFVAFVGDGTNDAPVLTRADVGIAMGGLGSDAAIEAADVVIMDDAITKIPAAIQITQKTMRIVKENIGFSLGIKIIILLLSALGYATMWEAVFADVGVTLLAICNSLRAFHK